MSLPKPVSLHDVELSESDKAGVHDEGTSSDLSSDSESESDDDDGSIENNDEDEQGNTEHNTAENDRSDELEPDMSFDCSRMSLSPSNGIV